MNPIAISNIAWDPADDEAVVALMKDYDIGGLEIAPAKINPTPSLATAQQIDTYKRIWKDRNITLTSMQALLFGAPYTAIFEGDDLRQAMMEQLKPVLEMAGKLGTRRLVFGSPKNRLKGDLSYEQAFDIAVPFFTRLAGLAQDNSVQLCIEPNPDYYGCDFVTDSSQGISLVEAVNHPGFGLHLDAAGMTLSGENIPAAIQAASGKFSHFHISEKDLAPIGSGTVDHAVVAAAIRESGYNGWLSIEMRPDSNAIRNVEQAFELVKRIYC